MGFIIICRFRSRRSISYRLVFHQKLHASDGVWNMKPKVACARMCVSTWMRVRIGTFNVRRTFIASWVENRSETIIFRIENVRMNVEHKNQTKF